MADWTPRATTEGNPVWFGPPARPLAGWLHLPIDLRAKAAVVLCPPLGIEGICVYFTYRRLAVRLAETGFAVLRFDYDGTGDSFGDQADPDRVEAWTKSVGEAIDLVRRMGADQTAVLGIRMGALLAAAVAPQKAVDALVLWDPCLSGSSFLREQQALHLLSVGGYRDEDSGDVEIPGLVFSRDTVSALGAMRLRDMDLSTTRRVLVLPDPDRPPLRGLAEQLSGAGSDWIDAIGQRDLLDPPRQETPSVTIEAITGWLDQAFADSPPVPMDDDLGSPEAVVGTWDGVSVNERFVQLGPSRLFGIVSQSRSTTADAPTVLFVNEGNTPHTGQSRMWVELSRRWAATGLRVLRWDLSGNGDSAARSGRPAHIDRAPEAFDDVEDTVKEISLAPPANVVLVGLCSGGYQAVEAALTLAPRGICLLNPIFTFIPPEPVTDPRRRAREAPKAWTLKAARGPVRWLARRRSASDVDRWSTSLENATWVTALARRYPMIPSWVWAVVKRSCVDNLAANIIERVVGLDIDVFLLCGERDFTRFELGSDKAIRRLNQRPNFHLQVVAGLDHSALAAEQRVRLMDLLTDHVVSHYAPSNVARSL